MKDDSLFGIFDDPTIKDKRTIPFLMVHRTALEMGLSWKAILAYTAILYHASFKNRSCSVFRITLAEVVGVSESTIYEGCRELEKRGILKVIRRSKGKKQLPSVYELLDPPPQS